MATTTKQTQTTIVDKLIETRGSAFSVEDVTIGASTIGLRNDIIKMMENQGIDEMIDILFAPVIDPRTQEFTDVAVIGVFECGGAGSNITSLSNGRNNGNSERLSMKNSVNLMGYSGRTVRSGSFRTSDKFKAVMASFAILDRNGEIVIRSAESNKAQNSNIAMVSLDFWTIIEVLGSCGGDTGVDYQLVKFNVIDGDKNQRVKDYKLAIKKMPAKTRKSKRHKNNGFNYENACANAIENYCRNFR